MGAVPAFEQRDRGGGFAMPRITISGPAVAFALALGMTVVGAVVSERNTRLVRDHVDQVARSYQVTGKLAEVMSLLQDAETGQRGYIITGDEPYLEPYLKGTSEVRAAAGELRELMRDNPVQLRRTDELIGQVDDRLRLLALGIDVRREHGVEAARLHILGGRGKEAMDATRALIGVMEAEEKELLIERQAAAGRAYAIARWAEALVVAASLCVIGLATTLISRELTARRGAEQALALANAALETRVRERTGELTVANGLLESEIVERRRAEEQVRAVAEELQRSNRELEQFAAVASHDLQEPLRKIEAFSDRLQKREAAVLSDPGRADVVRIVSAAHRMRQLIEDLLTYSRVTRKGRPFVRVDLEAVAREVIDDLGQRIEQVGGRVEVGPLPSVDADPLQMRQLLQNLIANALKFHKPGEGPTVRVGGRVEPGPEGGTCILSVQDDGIGFEQVYADRIFNVFERLHGRGEFEGTGMGLAICRRIAERHGGTIEARAEPGRGATFLVRWPARSAERRSVA